MTSNQRRALDWVNGVRAACNLDTLDAFPRNRRPELGEPRSLTCPMATALPPGTRASSAGGGEKLLVSPDFVKAAIREFDDEIRWGLE